MKIAIMTQPLHTNYGGTLQNFALQQVLIELGFQVETIDCATNFETKWKIFLRQLKNNILGNKKYVFTNEEIELIGVEHKRFINKKIILSQKIKSKKELKEYINSNDIKSIVVGSDQVWRKEYSPDIMSFFLDFNDSVKKISYAASFGVSHWQFNAYETKKIKKLLDKFNMISVRESDAVQLLKENVQIDAHFVLDPTLLLNKKDYMSLISLKEKKDKGIFCYILDKNEKKNKIIQYVCSYLNMNNFECMPNKKYKEKDSIIDDIYNYKYPSIEKWLESFYYTDFVITDSFHGTVFSIIFNKPFVTIANEERGNSRFISLLSWLNLENRLINTVDDIKPEHFISPNFEKINSLINEKSEFCKKLIFKSLS